jgi:demethylmenaquinone methyltransferase/2-methoxy-6-polyprenyl-1,4-benzoquinol methylase
MELDHFGLIAPLYNRTGPYTPSTVLLDALAIPDGASLLDAGGGTGRVAAGLRERSSPTVVADVSLKMLRYAGEKGLPSVCGPAERLPFADGCFDRILMVDAFHHLEDQERAAYELFRVLAPTGRLVIVEPDIRRPAVVLIAIMEKVLLMRSHFLTADRILALFPGGKFSSTISAERNSVLLAIQKTG